MWVDGHWNIFIFAMTTTNNNDTHQNRVNHDPEHSVKDRIRRSRASNNDRKHTLDKLMGWWRGLGIKTIKDKKKDKQSGIKHLQFLPFSSLSSLSFLSFHLGKLKRKIGIKLELWGKCDCWLLSGLFCFVLFSFLLVSFLFFSFLFFLQLYLFFSFQKKQ